MGRKKRNILLIVSAGAAVCLAAGAAVCLSALMPVRREIAAYQADSCLLYTSKYANIQSLHFIIQMTKLLNASIKIIAYVIIFPMRATILQ